MQRLIDADALKECFPDYGEGLCTFNVIINAVIDKHPTIEAEPVRHGKWEYGEDESGYDGYYCSNCFGHVRWYGKAGEQSINFIKKYNYCPYCGARMDKERKEK